jgi:hypothetical protein
MQIGKIFVIITRVPPNCFSRLPIPPADRQSARKYN